MAEVVGGAFLSTLFQALFEKIASKEVVGFFRGKKMNSGLLEKLKVSLSLANAVLDDAENKQIKNKAVKDWLEKLKEVMDDAERLLDEINTEVLRCEIEGKLESRPSKRLKLDLFLFAKFDKTAGLESEIEEVLDRLKFILEQKDLLGLEGGVQYIPLQRPSSCLVDESLVFGRNTEKEGLIGFLLSDDINGGKISVVSIVGMGGLGKTTLAQLAYNDSIVTAQFDCKAWITVSHEFDIHGITKTMLGSLSSLESCTDDLYELQVKLKQNLMGKKFLLVLDDVWSENYNLWDALKSPLESGARGSKIIVTTRSQIVASMIGSVRNYNLQGLLDEDCWGLFAKHVFNDFCERSDLEEIGREIVTKCKGLPLAVKSLAGLLRSVRDPKEWIRISQSDIWDLEPQVNSFNDVLPALWLSYYYLPPGLKRCFAYCSIFPKDYEMEKEKLILLWMAEGLLQPEKGKTMEDIGEDYFHDLISRSLFQRSSLDESTGILMHDLVHDLAVFVAGESCFRLECGNLSDTPEKVRHLSYISTRYDATSKFDSLYRAKSLRTFLPFKLSSSSEYFLTKSVVCDLLSSLQRLRVLSLSHYTNITALPGSISSLKHLRYLNLSHTPVKALPESISTLYNLQTLILSNCSSLIQLPTDIGRLVNLRHLFLDGTNLKDMPLMMGRLRNLQTLTSFGLGKGKGHSIKELKHFGNLRGALSVSGLENVDRPMDALEANLKEKSHLEKLELKWDIFGNGFDPRKSADVLEKLRPHVNLKRLTVKNYGGKGFPDWLGDNSFSNIVFLSLADCVNCDFLPSLGQLPSLKELWISGFDQLKKMGSYLDGSDYSSVQPFRSLETLKIEDMKAWQQWFFDAEIEAESEPFPCLRELHVVNCPKLTGNLPRQLPSLTDLIIAKCPELRSPLPVAPALSQLDVIECKNMVLENIPPRLLWLTIVGSNSVEFLFEDCDDKTSLVGLNISSCSSLKHLFRGVFPRMLKTLEITECHGLEFSMDNPHACLESLTICASCDSLTVFRLDLFPNLNRLHIEKCCNLASLSLSEEFCHESLNFLQISGCPKFVSFPRKGLSAPNLKWFCLEGCDKLKALPNQMHSLRALQDLFIGDCPELDSFPKGGLPKNLRTLSIFCKELFVDRAQWNLSSLSSLEYFSIGHGHEDIGHGHEDIVSFPQEGLLPRSLVSLHLSRLCCLKSLDYEGLRNLESLKELKISECHGLECLPIDELPCSVEFVQISDCPSLKKKCRLWARATARNVCIQFDNETISCE